MMSGAVSISRHAAGLRPVLLQSQSQLHTRATPSRLQCAAIADPQSTSADSSLVPRRCTLKELTFTDDGRLITNGPSAPVSRSSELMDLFLATVEASAQVKDLETLTGRLAMVAFFAALCLEYLTGSGLFNSLDREGLQRVLGLGLLSAIGGGAFVVAMRGKNNVTDILSNNCQRMMDSTVDSLVDAMFYEDAVIPHSDVEGSENVRA